MTEIKIKNFRFSFLLLTALIAASFAFFSYAENKSISHKNIFLDSDQDGLSDDEEKTYRTDPRKADTDNDGYSDGAEVKSGYDPTRPSPGDKLIPDKKPLSEEKADPNQKNLTKEVAQKISATIKNSESENRQVTTEQIKDIVNESLTQESSLDELPAIEIKELKIKKQDYKSLSKEKQFERKKSDMSDYVAGISYIFLSNSPEPIKSNDDLEKLNAAVMTKIAAALNAQNSASVSDLGLTSEKILSQMKDIEVPEEMVENHIKGLQLFTYARNMEKLINPVAGDPLSDLANYSKIQALTLAISDFSTTISEKLEEYDLSLDGKVKTKLKDYGSSFSEDFLETNK